MVSIYSSACKLLRNQFKFLLCYEGNTPKKMPPVRIKMIEIASAIIVLAWLKDNKRFGRLATCRCVAPAMVSSNAISLVADESTRE